MQAAESLIRPSNAWQQEKALIKARAYVAGVQYNFIWTPQDKAKFRRLWRENRGLMYICNELDRHWVEVMVLAADLLDRGQIKDRERPLFG
ncbi:hypothetical protein KM908_20385 [Alkalihalobacillus clausii]|uniref:hypothetical protein n=1 Tax=Shouchella clausii TaxID=79880 RepID=UPI001C2492A9|nr:hypothetical protein [Shouchella clausii]MBU8598473.1 hypothetical protein [Shouchella clausii]